MTDQISRRMLTITPQTISSHRRGDGNGDAAGDVEINRVRAAAGVGVEKGLP